MRPGGTGDLRPGEMRRCPDGFQCDLRRHHRRPRRPDLFQRHRRSGAHAARPRLVRRHLGIADRCGLRTGSPARRRRPPGNRALRSGPRVRPRRVRRPRPAAHRTPRHRTDRPRRLRIRRLPGRQCCRQGPRIWCAGWYWRTRWCRRVPVHRSAAGWRRHGDQRRADHPAPGPDQAEHGRLRQGQGGAGPTGQGRPGLVGVAHPDHGADPGDRRLRPMPATGPCSTCWPERSPGPNAPTWPDRSAGTPAIPRASPPLSCPSVTDEAGYSDLPVTPFARWSAERLTLCH